MPHSGQLHNMVIYMRASSPDVKHDSRLGGCDLISPIARFFLPDLILHVRHIHACFELLCVWFLSLHSRLLLYISVDTYESWTLQVEIDDVNVPKLKAYY